jgi:hypothetical protein
MWSLLNQDMTAILGSICLTDTYYLHNVTTLHTPVPTVWTTKFHFNSKYCDFVTDFKHYVQVLNIYQLPKFV